MTPPSSSQRTGLIIGIVIGGIVLAGGGFFAGTQYQKMHGGAASAAAGTQPGAGGGGAAGGRGFGMRNGSVGDVTAISADSITVNDARSGTAKTFKITSATVITNQGNTATVSDIASGDQVFVQASSTDTSTATRISLGGFGGGAPAGGGMGGSQAN